MLGGSQSLVIGDLNIVRSVVLPEKTDAVLIVDSYAVLAAPASRRSNSIFEILIFWFCRLLICSVMPLAMHS
jgi:hypothetical protein